MFFEAELNGRKYQINVHEEATIWKVSLKDEEHELQTYEISKRDFKQAEQYISFLFEGSSYLIDVVGADTEYTVFTRNSFRSIKIFNEEMLLNASLKKGGNLSGAGDLRSGMPGKIIEIFAKEGQTIAANEPLLIMEAMKMENEMRAPRDVKVKSVLVKQGDSVESGAVLIQFED